MRLIYVNLNDDPEMAISLKRKNTTAELNMASPMFIFAIWSLICFLVGQFWQQFCQGKKPPSHLSNLAMGNPELAMEV